MTPEGTTDDPLGPFDALVVRWREDASTLRTRGASHHADTLESAADDLETRLREWRLERLTLTEAAREAGSAYDTIQRKVASGDLPNAGEKGSPRIRRCDLHEWMDVPPATGSDADDPDVAGEVLARAG